MPIKQFAQELPTMDPQGLFLSLSYTHREKRKRKGAVTFIVTINEWNRKISRFSQEKPLLRRGHIFSHIRLPLTCLDFPHPSSLPPDRILTGGTRPPPWRTGTGAASSLKRSCRVPSLILSSYMLLFKPQNSQTFSSHELYINICGYTFYTLFSHIHAYIHTSSISQIYIKHLRGQALWIQN